MREYSKYLYGSFFSHGTDVKIVARENAKCLVTLENHYSQWLVSKQNRCPNTVSVNLVLYNSYQ